MYKNETVFNDYEGTVIGRCENCGILKTFPSRKNKLFNPVTTKVEEYERRKKEFEKLFARLTASVEQRVVRKGSVLDVGCSSGILLSLLKRKGFDVWGLEPNKQAFLYAKKILKNNISNDTLSSYLKKQKMKFDCIIYNHVLEHIEDVNAELSLIKRALKKNGVLIIGVPNTHNMIFKIRRKFWESLLPNEHIWHFNTKYLVEYLQKQGFEIVKIGFEDDARRTYPLLKRVYFTLLSLLNRIMGTGEAVLIIAQRI
ncbi:class I SAM-dependent methyltransferase [Candidatus Roizmanbacteria bacterium]|nr:class I SAM-dependent methyltransferase [Candidatus Roizmanbacteria bacterium]